MKLKCKLDPDAIMPVRAHSTDAGLDLFSTVDMDIPPDGAGYFDTGVHVQIPEGYVGMLTSKSGLMSMGLTSRGTIDCGYTGSIRVVLYNHRPDTFSIKKGEKISQLVILPIITPDLEIVAHLDDTERGTGGFGSTGR